MQHVVLCTPDGVALEPCERGEAHRSPGRLHRAFSVFVFRRAGTELLVQQRHASKLFGSLWANSCCSHPRPGEQDLVAAAQRRLRQECGFSTPLWIAGSFVYQAEDPHGRGAEHEYDTVLVGNLPDADALDDASAVRTAADEVAAWKWIRVEELDRLLHKSPADYAPWLPPALKLAVGARYGRPGESSQPLSEK